MPSAVASCSSLAHIRTANSKCASECGMFHKARQQSWRIGDTVPNVRALHVVTMGRGCRVAMVHQTEGKRLLQNGVSHSGIQSPVAQY